MPEGQVPYFFVSLMGAILAGALGGILFIYIGVSVPQAPIAANTIFVVLGLFFLSFFVVVSNRGIWRATFYDNHLDYGRLSMNHRLEYTQIDSVNTARENWSFRTLVILQLKGQNSQLVIPGNPRNSILQTDMAKWLEDKLQERTQITREQTGEVSPHASAKRKEG